MARTRKRRTAATRGAKRTGPARANPSPRRSAASGPRPDVRAWLGRVERATLARRPAPVEAARQAFNGLSLTDKLALAREIVETRAAELCLAYRDVVAVSYGFRRQRADGRHTIVREPCVTFLVKRKWARERRGAARRQLPRHLFGYWTIDGARTVCAVPTDVEDGRERARIRPQASTAGIVVRAAEQAVTGVVTCGVERGGQLFALSCQHVFSLSKKLPSNPFRAATVGRNGAPIFATTTEVRGVFDDAAAWSLDAQLALVDEAHRTEFRTALGGLDITGVAAGPHDLTAIAFWYIITPDGPIRAQLTIPELAEEHEMDFGRPGVRRIRHETLLLLQTDAPTREGHSGAPVVSDPEGGLFIGMHIAGDKKELSAVVPAWHLLDSGRYQNAAAGESWRVVTR